MWVYLSCPHLFLLAEFTENIGLALNLLEEHDPWPAYVTYISPVVQRLIEKSKPKELQCPRASQQSQSALRPNKPSSITQLKRRKSSMSSGEGLKDDLSHARLSIWAPNSALSPTVVPEPKHKQPDSRERPTADFNKIIFSRKPMMRMVPYQLTTVQQGETCKCLARSPCSHPWRMYCY